MEDWHVTEGDVVRLLVGHLRRQFPKPCPSCGRVYADLRDYVQHTTPLGPAISYDLDEPPVPGERLGALALAQCGCGDTLSLGTDGLSPAVARTLLDWVRREAAARSVGAASIVESLRQRIREATLSGNVPEREH